ncbi:unnamed protein product [Ixodes hexagonus]
MAVCYVNFPEEEMNQYMKEKLKYKVTRTHFGCLDRSGKLRVRAGTDVLFVFRPTSDETERLKDELLCNGFVQPNTQVSPEITGPEFKSSSPYYRPLGKLLNRAHEAASV